MAGVTTNADGTKSTDGLNVSSLLGGLIDRAIGSNSTRDTNSTQSTTGSSSSTGMTTVAGQQNTQQQQNQVTAGTTQGQTTSNTSGMQQSLQNQQQRQTGNVSTSTSGGRNFNSVQQSNADTSRLEDVYAAQRAGISPDMLAAIFREGSKQAPNALLAQSQALGARANGNTPVAVALNMLNRDMVDSAAKLNVQMLQQAGATAAQIADLTKSVSNTGSENTFSNSNQVTDMLTALTGNNTTLSSQQTQQNSIQDTLNQIIGNTSSSTANAQVTDTAQSAQQQQQVIANETQKLKQTINTDGIKSVAKAAAAGVGLMELYKIAKDAGLVTSAKDLVSQLGGTLSGMGADIKKWFTDASAIDAADAQAPAFSYNVDPTEDDIPVKPIVDDRGDEDFGPWGFADGGQIAIPNLLKFLPLISASRDDLKGIDLKQLASLGGSSSGSLNATELLAQLLQGRSLPGKQAQLPQIPPAQDSSPSVKTPRDPAEKPLKPPPAQDVAGPNVGIPQNYNPSIGGGNVPLDHTFGLTGGGGSLGGSLDIGSILGGSGVRDTGSISAPISGGAASAPAPAPYEGSIGTPTGDVVKGADYNKYVDTGISVASKLAGLNPIAAIGLKVLKSLIGPDLFKAEDSRVMQMPTDIGGMSNGHDKANEIRSQGDIPQQSLNFDATPLELIQALDLGGADSNISDILAQEDSRYASENPYMQDTISDSGGSDDFMDSGDDSSDTSDSDGFGGGTFQFGNAERMIKWKLQNEQEMYADGGRIMAAFGVSCTDDGGLKLNRDAAIKFAELLKRGGPPKFADGGELKIRQKKQKNPDSRDEEYANGGHLLGPGTGISDSIDATGPGGREIQLSNGEYIISKDVVDALGVDFFDALQDQYHIPAEMQQALGVK